MSRAFSQAKLKAEERRAILQAIETQMQQVIIDGVTQVLQEFLEKDAFVTTIMAIKGLALAFMNAGSSQMTHPPHIATNRASNKRSKRARSAMSVASRSHPRLLVS